MKTRIFGFISASLALASIVACSSSSSNGTSPADACTSYGNALIANTAKCAGTIDPAQNSAIVARYSQLCQAELALPGVASSAGASVAACASAVQAADCNTNFNDLEACSAIDSTGTLADGATCSQGLQCSSGSCDTSSSGSGSADGGTATTDTRCGKCVPAIADGGDCTGGGSCVKGDTCTFKVDSDGNFKGACTAKASAGAVGASCTSSTECQAPAHCAVTFTNGTDSGVCTAPVAAGGTCEESSDCVSGLVCGGSDTARVCGNPGATGATCTGGDCAVGNACNNTTQKCEKITWAAAGGTCNGTSILCSKGSCNLPTSGGGSGDPAGTCPTIIADGAACNTTDTTSECDEFADCQNGKCIFIPAVCK